MKKKQDNEIQTAQREIATLQPRCPRCKGELKQMRCRLDGPELYCPSCRMSFTPSELEKQRA